ncbi:hypothetical protein ACFY2R_29110 [Micromonospora olivasterospora]|uniref:hypothetical protein n=1 Tax=Micromonospora olivasterospora TaxID=1880 RepID=UPI0014795FF2|nr:hypothetical protein [Micromonospora olivasterospora]
MQVALALPHDDGAARVHQVQLLRPFAREPVDGAAGQGDGWISAEQHLAYRPDQVEAEERASRCPTSAGTPGR